MHSETADDKSLLIRCPSCSQRFKIAEELRGRTVECGGCEKQFKIGDNVIVRGRKVYPGERKTSQLNRFQRVPLALLAPLPGPIILYGGSPDPAWLEPTSPQRIIAGVVGVAAMILVALIFMFAGNPGGLLDGVSVADRLLIGGFTCLIGVILLIYGNPRARVKAFIVGMLFTAGVLAIPFKFHSGVPKSAAVYEADAWLASTIDSSESKPFAGEQEIAVLRNKIGTNPLVKEIDRLAKEGGTKTAVGLWLRGLSEVNRITVRDYIFRATGADSTSANFYPRDGNDFLMVVSGARQSFEGLTDVVGAVGSVEKVYPELSVIEIQVNNDNFTEGPIDKLTRPEDPAFYTLNKRELECIDLDRVKKAAQRLAESEPKVYRSDITARLILLLEEPAVDFKGIICRALSKWSETPGQASKVAVGQLKLMMDRKVQIPHEMISLIVKEKNPDVIPYLDRLWVRDVVAWEAQYADMGPMIEPEVLKHLSSADGSFRHSVVRLLGKIGGNESLSLLSAVKPGSDVELQVLLEQASKSIRGRLNQ